MIERVGSWLFYLAVFGAALILFAFAERCFSAGDECGHARERSLNRVRASLFSVLAIVLISTLAAIRADGVGVDTESYARDFSYFVFACGDFGDAITYSINMIEEPLTALLYFISSFFGSEPYILFFLYQLLSILPVFLAAYKMRDDASITLSMAVYLFVFFNNSLNAVRQSVACGFILLGMILLIKGKRLSSGVLISLVIAAISHRTGVYGLILVFAVYALSVIQRKGINVAVMVCVAIAPVFLDQILSLATSAGFLSVRISDYAAILLSSDGVGENASFFVDPFSPKCLIYLLFVFIMLCIPYVWRTNSKDEQGAFLRSNSASAIAKRLQLLNAAGFFLFAGMLFGMSTFYGIRLSVFLDYFFIISLPLAAGDNIRRKWLLVAFLIVFWTAWIVIRGWSGSELFAVRFFE